MPTTFVPMTLLISPQSWSRNPLPRPRPALARSASTGRPLTAATSVWTPAWVDRSDLQGLDVAAERAQFRRRGLNGRLVCGDEQIEAVFGTLLRQLSARYRRTHR